MGLLEGIAISGSVVGVSGGFFVIDVVFGIGFDPNVGVERFLFVSMAGSKHQGTSEKKKKSRSKNGSHQESDWKWKRFLCVVVGHSHREYSPRKTGRPLLFEIGAGT